MRVDRAGLELVTKEYGEIVEMGKLLGLVHGAVESLAEVESLEAVGQGKGLETSTNAAVEERKVKLLLQAGSALVREEIRRVPAVRGLVKRARVAAAGVVVGLIREARRQAFGLEDNARLGVSNVVARLSEGHVVMARMHAEGDAPMTTTTIACVAQLDAVEDVLRVLREDARRVLRREVVRVVHTLDMEDGERGNETPVCVVRGVLKRSERFFLSACGYIRRLVASRIISPSSGLTLLRGNCGDEEQFECVRMPRESLSAHRECRALWEGVQRELLHVVAAVLGLRMADDGEHERDPFYDSIRRTNSVDHRPGLVFSVDDQVGGWDGGSDDGDGDDGGKRDDSLDTPNSLDNIQITTGELMRVVKGAIGDDLCSVRSSPALYQPVLTFVSDCCKYMDEVARVERIEEEERARHNGDTSSPTSLSSPSSPSMSFLGQALDRIQATAANLSRVALRNSLDSRAKSDARKEFLLSYLVDILRSDFVPSVYIECGHRTQELVACMGVSTGSVGVTYSVAQNTVELIKDMLDWSSMASVVAYDVIGVLENSLGKIAESLRAHVYAAGERAHQLEALRMARDPKISHLMAREPIATLVGGPEWFACRDAMDAALTDSFLTSAMASGFALGKHVIPDELFKYFTDRVLIDRSSLVLQGNSTTGMTCVVQMAAIGQAAERIANGMYEAVGAFSEKTRGKQAASFGEGTYDDLDQTIAGQPVKFIGLVDVANRYRAVSGLCTRTLRIEAMLTVAHAMQRLMLAPDARGKDDEEGDNPDAANLSAEVALVAPKLASMDDVLAHHLPLSLRQYIFGSLEAFLAKISEHVASRGDPETARRVLAVIEPVLRSLGGGECIR